MALANRPGGRHLAYGISAAAAGLGARFSYQYARRAAQDFTDAAAGAAYNATKNMYKRSRSNTTFVERPSKRARNNAIKRQNARIGGLIGLEVKFADFTWAETLAYRQSLPNRVEIDDAAGNVVDHLTPVAQGSGESQRIGRNIFVRSINLKMWVTANFVNTAAAPSFESLPETCAVTMWIVKDKQCNSTTPTASAIWTDPTTYAGFTSTYPETVAGSEPMINLEYRERFQIVKKKKFLMRRTPIATWNGTNVDYILPNKKEFKKFYMSFGKPWKQQYDATGGAVGNVTNESYTLWAHLQSDNVLFDSVIQVYGMGRVRYTS